MKSQKEAIKESLAKIVNENNKIRKYHLSYDLIKEIEIDANDARKYVLTVLKLLHVSKIQSPCESTIVFEYKNEHFNLEQLSYNLKNYFYHSICLVSLNENGIYDEKIFESKEINDFNLQKIFNDCDISEIVMLQAKFKHVK